MIASYQLPNYWTWKVFLCVVDDGDSCSGSDIAELYKRNHSIDFTEVAAPPPCCLIDDESMCAVICLKGWSRDNYHVGLIAHELMHLMIAISASTNCEMSNHTTECWAYTLESFMETILDILEEKEKERPACS